MMPDTGWIRQRIAMDTEGNMHRVKYWIWYDMDALPFEVPGYHAII